MRHTTLRVATLFVAALMLTAVVAVGGVAALDSTAESDFDAEEPISDQFNASSDEPFVLEVESDEDTESIEATIEHDDVDHLTVDDSDGAYELDEAAGTDDADVHAWDLDESDLESLPGDAGEEVTFTVNVTHVFEDGAHEDADDDDLVTEHLEFEDSVVFDDEYALVYVDEPDSEEMYEAGLFSLDTVAFWASSDEIPIQSYDESVGIVDSNTTIHVYDATDNGTDAFGEVMDDLDDGDIAFGAAATVDGSPAAVFYESADSDLVDEDDDTYVVYDGTHFEVNLGADDFDEDDDEVEVFVDSQNALDAGLDGADFGDLYADTLEFGAWDLSSEFGPLEIIRGLGVLPFIG